MREEVRTTNCSKKPQEITLVPSVRDYIEEIAMGYCQVQVYSSRGSSQVWMEADEEEGQRLDKGLVQAELRPIGFNDKGIEH